MMMTQSKADESFTYASDDAIARLTGLTLNPEPHHPQHHDIQNSNNSTSSHSNDETSTNNNTINENHADKQENGEETHFESSVTLRSLVTTKEAGVIIGKGGKNVAEIRELTNVKAGVSKVIAGVHERILTVSGQLDSVAKAYSLIARHLLENPTSSHPPPNPDCTTIRLLVAHQLMGSIIGKGGSKIKEIQEASGAKIVVSKEMLPQSTERVIDVYGLVDSIQIAVYHIGECVLADLDRATGSIPYNPQVRLGGGIASVTSRNRYGEEYSGSRPRNYNSSNFHRRTSSPGGTKISSASDLDVDGLQTQTLSIPADMVGCIIGKGGANITEIRKSSGSRISIAKAPQGDTNERIFTITGTPETNQRALYLLYSQLEGEKERKLGGGGSGTATEI